MKSIFKRWLFLFPIVFSVASTAQHSFTSSDEPSFFTTTDRSNWVYIIKDKSIDSSAVFKMENGKLLITGVSSGYLRTKQPYSEFELSTDWRWTVSPGNSGVLVYIQPKDVIWPVCYQIQQKAGDAGDVICMNGLWAKECTDSVRFTVKKIHPSNEKPLGEWNSMKVICKGNTLTVFVNGKLQNEISCLTVSDGFIGFQNEGKPIEFRNLKIIQFTK